MQIYKPLALSLLLLCGCATPPVALRFHEQVSESLPTQHARVVNISDTHQRLVVDQFPQLSEKDVIEARLEPTPGGQAVLLKFDLHGANKLSELTTRMRGRYLVIFFKDRPVAAWLVEHRILDGQFLLEADLTDEEQKTLVDSLNKAAGRGRDYGDTRYRP